MDIVIKSETKPCSKCKGDYPATEEYFYKQKVHRKKKGTYYVLSSWCKKCNLEKQIPYQNNNKERQSERFKEWYIENKDEKIKSSMKWNEENSERKLENYYKWTKDNPDKIKTYREQHRSHDITNQEWEDCKEYFNQKCAYCGIHISDHYITFKGKEILGDFHKEHVYHDGENDLSNCVPSCKSCNVKKHTRKFEDWYSESSEIFQQDNMDRIVKWLSEDYKEFKKPFKPKQKYTKRHEKWFKE